MVVSDASCGFTKSGAQGVRQLLLVPLVKTMPSQQNIIDAMHAVADLEPSDESSVPKETKSKRCQANVSVSQRTRRIQVSMDRKETVSTGIQCSSLFDDIPLRVAAGLIFVPKQLCDL